MSRLRAGKKRCQEKGPSRERNQAKLGRNERYFNRKRSQEMRDVKIQSFQEEDMSRERGLKKNTCQEQGQRERTVKRKWCQEKETSRKRIVKRNKCQGCQALSIGRGAKRMGFQDSEPRKTAHQTRSSEDVKGKMDSKEMQVPSRFAGFRRLASCNGRKILQRNDWMIANRLHSLFPPNQDARQMMRVYCLFIVFYSALLHPNPWSQSHPSLFIMSLLLIPSEHQIGLNLLSPGVGRIVALDDLCWAVRHHRHTSAYDVTTTKHYETWPQDETILPVFLFFSLSNSCQTIVKHPCKPSWSMM